MIKFAWAKSPSDHMSQYKTLATSSQGGREVPGIMSQMKRHAAYVSKSINPEEHGKLHKNISAHANRLLKANVISAEQAQYIKKTYSPPVKESKDMDIQERKMSKPEMDKREKTVKSMKKSYGDFKKRYGERAKEVMYATATKQAMKSEEVEQVDEADELRLRSGNMPTFNKTAAGKAKEMARNRANLKQQMKDTRRRGGLTGPQGKLPEETEGQHYCAKHVYSEVFGEGVVVEGQHAEPDASGNIEWYTVQFDHGEEVIFTEDVEVMMAEYHNNHSPMKKKAKKAKE